jgi:hypothetical protein
MIIKKGKPMKKFSCFIFGLVVVMSCGTKQPRIDKIYEGGVEVVLNHLEPYTLIGGPVHLLLENDITIDLEKEEYSGLGLKMPEFVDADSKGNIFITERYGASEYFINKFDSNGKFLKKIGKKGQGPGEIQAVRTLLVDRHDRIRIFDGSALKVVDFDSEGNLIEETRIPHGLTFVYPLANGNYLAMRYPKDKSETYGMYLDLYDPDFKEIKRLDVYDMSDLTPGKKNHGLIVPFHWRVSGERIFVGNGQRGYEIQVFDLEGKLLRKIRKEYKPVQYPEEFRKQTERIIAANPAANLYVIKNMPPFNSFFIDDGGRLFVMTYEQGENKDEFIHDIFNPDGVFIGRVSLGKYGILGRALNHLNATAANGRFYRLTFKESGYPEVIVYRMEWQ